MVGQDGYVLQALDQGRQDDRPAFQLFPEFGNEFFQDFGLRPDSEKNPIKLGSRGVVPVVLYGEVDFAVEDVDVDTLAFGPDASSIAHRNGPHFDDIDGDGLLDMILHHRIADTGLTAYDVEACLNGQTIDGASFEGCDDVTPVGR